MWCYSFLGFVRKLKGVGEMRCDWQMQREGDKETHPWVAAAMHWSSVAPPQDPFKAHQIMPGSQVQFFSDLMAVAMLARCYSISVVFGDHPSCIPFFFLCLGCGMKWVPLPISLTFLAIQVWSFSQGKGIGVSRDFNISSLQCPCLN